MENKQINLDGEIAGIEIAATHIATLAKLLYQARYDNTADEFGDIAAAISDSIELQAKSITAAAERAEQLAA